MSQFHVTRKGLLRSAGAAALAATLPGRALAAPAAVPGATAGGLAGLASLEEIWSWEQQLADWSPPWPGTPGHRSFVDWIAAEFEAAGLDTRRRSLSFDYWELPSRHGLRAETGEEIPVACYQHYSGPTGPEGVTAPLAWIGASTAPLSAIGVAGKIAVFEMPTVGLPTAMYESLGTYPASAAGDVDPAEVSPTASFLSSLVPRAEEAARLGAVGAIFAWGPAYSEGAVMHQTPHWLAGPLEIPALFVGNGARRRLMRLAGAGVPVTLTLESSITPGHTSDNVWALLPGQTDEVILVNTHSDGCNAYEENGPLAVVAMARYFAQKPISERRRTLAFACTTGHFGHGLVPGAATFESENADLVERIVAVVTPEHLGANEWIDQPRIGADKEYAPSGRYHWDWVYCRPGRGMANVFLQSASGTEFRLAQAVRPWANRAGIQFGEGSDYADAGKPVIATMGHPWYLFTQPPNGEIDKLSPERLHGEVVALTRCVNELDVMDAEAMLEA